MNNDIQKLYTLIGFGTFSNLSSICKIRFIFAYLLIWGKTAEYRMFSSMH